MYLLALSIPLISFTVIWTTNTRLNITHTNNYTTLSILITWITSSIILYECILNETNCHTLLWNWIELDYLNCNITLNLDLLSSTMLFIITTISLFVHFYSTSYMNNDPHTNRFMSYLSLFTFFMVILISSNNYLFLLIGWEGVGICSYLLINFWLTRIQANNAGVNAIIINRISDTTLLISIILITTWTGSTNFENSNSLLWTHTHNNLLCLLLLASATGNSSLIGLHMWLPDAMEGPTPISALIHAATMVTAGIFLLIRSSHILETSNSILLLTAWLGATTAFFAATTSSMQNDINRIIAYSTCSQLGFMALAIGLCHYSISLLHLINHAFFNSLLFLGAGITIHTINNEQDIRNLSNLTYNLPITYITITTGCLTLTGLPFLTSYYSNDLILENTHNHSILILLTFTAASLTALYSTRLIYLTFIQTTNSSNNNHIITSQWQQNGSLTIITLSITSIIAGYFLYSPLISNITHPINPQLINSLPINCSILSFIIILIAHNNNNNSKNQTNYIFQTINTFTSNAWYFNTIYNNIITSYIINQQNTIQYNTIDQGILESINSQNIYHTTTNTSNTISLLQSSNIQTHTSILLIFFISLTLSTHAPEAQNTSSFLNSSWMQNNTCLSHTYNMNSNDNNANKCINPQNWLL